MGTERKKRLILLTRGGAFPAKTTMKERLQKHISSIRNMPLFYTCREILDCEEFYTWPASLSFHHAYEGGLLAHTVEVCDIAKQIAGYHENPEKNFAATVNHDILIAAALWHDIRKVWEYEAVHHLSEEPLVCKHLNYANDGGMATSWVHTNYGKLIHHIPGSAIEFTVAARKNGVADGTIEQIQHCILAHHGRKEWGSPVEPQTLEALILHQADMLSAKFGATKDALP